MRKVIISGLLAICFLMAGAASSYAGEQKGPSAEAAIREANKGMAIIYVKPFEAIPGLYELGVPDGKGGKAVLYSSADGKYIVNGHIFDTETKVDLTAATIDTVNGIDWKKLPLDKAIVSGDPKGSPVAIFTDPDCPYCKQLEKDIINAKGLKIYTFLYPIKQLHPDARAKAETIWCSKDQAGAMRDMMARGKTLDALTCENPVDEIITLAGTLGIRGTPTIIAGDGRKRSGALPAAQLVEWVKKGNK
ncbi:MAG: DsbC family protein [Mariprofundaceae bacterium]